MEYGPFGETDSFLAEQEVPAFHAHENISYILQR
jgi:hypothetical protein